MACFGCRKFGSRRLLVCIRMDLFCGAAVCERAGLGSRKQPLICSGCSWYFGRDFEHVMRGRCGPSRRRLRRKTCYFPSAAGAVLSIRVKAIAPVNSHLVPVLAVNCPLRWRTKHMVRRQTQRCYAKGHLLQGLHPRHSFTLCQETGSLQARDVSYLPTSLVRLRLRRQNPNHRSFHSPKIA